MRVCVSASYNNTIFIVKYDPVGFPCFAPNLPGIRGTDDEVDTINFTPVSPRVFWMSCL